MRQWGEVDVIVQNLSPPLGSAFDGVNPFGSELLNIYFEMDLNCVRSCCFLMCSFQTQTFCIAEILVLHLETLDVVWQMAESAFMTFPSWNWNCSQKICWLSETFCFIFICKGCRGDAQLNFLNLQCSFCGCQLSHLLLNWLISSHFTGCLLLWHPNKI